MPKITPFLWYDNQAEEAARFYCSIFKNSQVLHVNSFDAGGPPAPEVVISVNFSIEGQEFIALNGGPHFKFNEAFSIFVSCADQAEVDYCWERLTADGGEESMCGWLKDKFGLSWQIVPEKLMELIGNPDAEKAQRATQAMLKMHKIELGEIQRAFEGE